MELRHQENLTPFIICSQYLDSPLYSSILTLREGSLLILTQVKSGDSVRVYIIAETKTEIY